MQKTLKGSLTKIMKILLEQNASKNKKPVRAAIEYVEKNYSQEIRLEDVAEAVGLNAVYLSNLFKKEIGENFTDYLNKYRIEEAKGLS